MNSFFEGKADQEDLKAIDQIRRQLVPMIGIMDKMRVDLERGNADWPTVQRFQQHISAYLSSIHHWLSGGSKQNTEPNGERSVEYQGPHMPRLQALHPFPIAPFPIGNENLAGLAQTLLRKRLEPGEEKWVEERLARAASFCNIPAEWEVEPRKTEVKEEEGQARKRVQGTMTEDQIVGLWATAHRTVFDPEYGPTLEEAEEDEEGEEGDDEGEDGQEEEGEDAMDTSEAPAPVAVPGSKKRVTRLEPVVTGPPVLPLGFVHRFMTSGEVLGAGGK